MPNAIEYTIFYFEIKYEVLMQNKINTENKFTVLIPTIINF